MDLGHWSQPELHARHRGAWGARFGFHPWPALCVRNRLVWLKPPPPRSIGLIEDRHVLSPSGLLSLGSQGKQCDFIYLTNRSNVPSAK